MNLSQTGLTMIKRFEGLRLRAYKPVPTEKYWTIGYGHYGPDVKATQVITEDQANDILMNDLERFIKAVNDHVKVPLNQNQFDALVSFTYNCGIGALRDSTLLDYVNQKKFDLAAKEFDKWVHGGGKVLGGLVNRRNIEQELFVKEVVNVEPKEQPTSFPLAQAWVKVKGISDGTNPKEPVTREQLWSMLYRMNGGKGK